MVVGGVVKSGVLKHYSPVIVIITISKLGFIHGLTAKSYSLIRSADINISLTWQLSNCSSDAVNCSHSFCSVPKYGRKKTNAIPACLF